MGKGSEINFKAAEAHKRGDKLLSKRPSEEGLEWDNEMISGYSYDKYPNINSNYLFVTQTSSAKAI